MRKKIAMRLRREALRRGARIESVEFIPYRGLLECMDWAEEEGPPENERSVIIH